MERWEEKPFTSNARHTKKPSKDKWFVKKDERHMQPCPRPGNDSLSQKSEIVECNLKCCDVVLRKVNSDIVEKALEDSKLENTELDFDKVYKKSYIEVAASMNSTNVSSAIDPDDLNKPFHGWSKEIDPRCGLPWVQQDYSGYDLLTPFKINPSLTLSIGAGKKKNSSDLKGSAFKKATGQVFPGSRCGVESDVNISRADLGDKSECCEEKALGPPSCKPEHDLEKRKPSKRTQPKASDEGQKRTSERKKLKSRMLNVRKTCRRCLKKSASYNLNLVHEQLNHSYVCQICTDGLFSFVDANGLKRHQEQMHSQVSLETTKQKTSSSKALESEHVTKNIGEDVAILAVMPKILKKNYSCERVPKQEDIQHVSVQNGNESKSDAIKSSNGKQIVKEEKFAEELKPFKHLDVNKNESIPVDGGLKSNPPNLIKPRLSVPSKPTFHENGRSSKKEEAFADEVPNVIDNMNNLWSTNLFDATPDTLVTQSTRETSPYRELEASSTATNLNSTSVINSGVKLSNIMSGVIKDTTIQSSIIGRGRVKTRGGVRPRMQGQVSDGARPRMQVQVPGGARLRLQGQMPDGVRPRMQGQVPAGASGANFRPPSVYEIQNLRASGARGAHPGPSGVPGVHHGAHPGSSGVRGAHRGVHPGSSGVRGAHPGSAGVRRAHPGSSGIRGAHPESEGHRGEQPEPSGVHRAHPRPSGVHGDHPGPSGVRRAHPVSSGVHGEHPESPGVHRAHPGSSGVREAHPGSSGIRGVYPGFAGARGEHTGISGVCGAYPGSAGVHGAYPGSTAVRGAHPRPSGVSGAHPSPSGVHGAHPSPSGACGGHPSPKSVRRAHPSPSGVCGAHPSPSAVRGVHHSSSGVHEAHPSPSGVHGAHPSPSGVHGAHPSPSGVLGAHPSPSGVRGTHPSPSGVRGTHPSPSGVRGTHPSPSGVRGAHPSPSGVHGLWIPASKLPEDPIYVPVDPANLPPTPQPKTIKVETIDISDEESLPPELDRLQSCGISVTRNRTPTKLKSLELPPGISVLQYQANLAGTH